MKVLHFYIDQGMTWKKNFRIGYDLTTITPVMEIYEPGNIQFQVIKPTATVTDATNGDFSFTLPYYTTENFDTNALAYNMYIEDAGERTLVYEGNIKINKKR